MAEMDPELETNERTTPNGMLPEEAESLLNQIRAGDRVTILVPAGIGRNGQEWTERSGRAVMKSEYGWALNMGGQHGTPGVANARNIVKVRKTSSLLGLQTAAVAEPPQVDVPETDVPVWVYDNGGKSIDRYTIIFVETGHEATMGGFVYDAVAAGDDVTSPQGFYQHTEAKAGKHLGQEISIYALPAPLQERIFTELDSMSPTEHNKEGERKSEGKKTAEGVQNEVAQSGVAIDGGMITMAEGAAPPVSPMETMQHRGSARKRADMTTGYSPEDEEVLYALMDGGWEEQGEDILIHPKYPDMKVKIIVPFDEGTQEWGLGDGSWQVLNAQDKVIAHGKGAAQLPKGFAVKTAAGVPVDEDAVVQGWEGSSIIAVPRGANPEDPKTPAVMFVDTWDPASDHTPEQLAKVFTPKGRYEFYDGQGHGGGAPYVFMGEGTLAKGEKLIDHFEELWSEHFEGEEPGPDDTEVEGSVKEGEYSLMGSVGPVKTKPWARVRVLRSVMRSG